MRRLFSTFARGLPGAGLLLMRLVAGSGLIFHRAVALLLGPSLEFGLGDGLAIAAGLLLIAGLWTPILGALVAGLEMWKLFWHTGDAWSNILLGTLGAALAMLGPGVWSVDARLFGWKRINLETRKSRPPHSGLRF